MEYINDNLCIKQILKLDDYVLEEDVEHDFDLNDAHANHLHGRC